MSFEISSLLSPQHFKERTELGSINAQNCIEHYSTVHFAFLYLLSFLLRYIFIYRFVETWAVILTYVVANAIWVLGWAVCLLWNLELSDHPAPLLRHFKGREFAPITVAARSKAWTVFASSNTGVVCRIPRCLLVFVLCVDSALSTGWSPVQWFLLSVYRIKKLKKRPRTKKL
jgi:hypothetical protein